MCRLRIANKLGTVIILLKTPLVRTGGVFVLRAPEEAYLLPRLRFKLRAGAFAFTVEPCGPASSMCLKSLGWTLGNKWYAESLILNPAVNKEKRGKVIWDE